MTSCIIPTAHRYSTEGNFLENIVGKSGTDIFPACPHGFLIGLDSSAIWLLGSTMIGSIVWERAPRISSALLAGSFVAWVSSQILTLQLVLSNLRQRVSPSYSEFYEAARYRYEAALSQGVFELIVFLIIPALLVMLAKRIRTKILGHGDEATAPVQCAETAA